MPNYYKPVLWMILAAIILGLGFGGVINIWIAAILAIVIAVMAVMFYLRDGRG